MMGAPQHMNECSHDIHLDRLYGVLRIFMFAYVYGL